MLRTVLSFALSLLLFGSCADHHFINNEHNQNTCSVDDPVRNLAWLAAMVEEMEQSSIKQYAYVLQTTHQSKTVFISANCCPFCSSVFFVYDCEGNRIGSVGDKQFDDNLFRHATVIWKANPNSCSF